MKWSRFIHSRDAVFWSRWEVGGGARWRPCCPSYSVCVSPIKFSMWWLWVMPGLPAGAPAPPNPCLVLWHYSYTPNWFPTFSTGQTLHHKPRNSIQTMQWLRAALCCLYVIFSSSSEVERGWAGGSSSSHLKSLFSRGYKFWFSS